MSKYTTEFRYPVEQACRDAKLPHMEPSSWIKVQDKLGLGRYPIFDEEHRAVLNEKIIRHFWMREIGFETWGQFKWYLDMKMCEIMPYYNQLYKSELIKFDPLSTRDMECREIWNIDNTRDSTTDRDTKEDSVTTGETTSDGRTTDHNRNVFQETPMSLLDNDSAPTVEGLDYATTVTYDDANGTSHDQTDTNGTRKATINDNTVLDEDKTEKGNRTRTEKGYDMPGADLLAKLRKTFLNIDMQVIEELEVLFMGIG